LPPPMRYSARTSAQSSFAPTFQPGSHESSTHP
jgi:hypothetical protein